MPGPEEKRLAERCKKMALEGLVDVRYAISNPREATVEQICAEVNAMHDAYERGDYVMLASAQPQ